VAKEKGGFWLRLAQAVFYPLSWALGRSRAEGLERIPRVGPTLVVSNHISYLDPLYTAVFVNRRGRIPRFLAKASLWKVPVLGRTMSGTGQIPVYRDSADAQHSLRDAIAALHEDKLVVIYPEGTVTRDPAGWPMRSHTGVARLALAADVPVIPVAHWGTREVWDHYGKRFRPLPRKPVVVRAGAPVDVSAFRGKPITGQLLREATDHIMAAVRRELGAVRGETPPTEFARRPRPSELRASGRGAPRQSGEVA
jgi:1-acyl-sn-glycerol-3-phosphate acyltransferase